MKSSTLVPVGLFHVYILEDEYMFFKMSTPHYHHTQILCSLVYRKQSGLLYGQRLRHSLAEACVDARPASRLGEYEISY